MSDPSRVGIVGLGLIGGSLARVLRRGDRPVVATTRAPHARAGARALGVEVVDDLGAVVARSDVVVVAAALDVLPAVVAEAAALAAGVDHLPTVTDVGSVKASVAAAVPAAQHALFVGGHPMAGTEHSGWEASEADLFHRRTWALAVDGATDLSRWADVARVALAAGSTIVPVDPAEHDAAVALTSHAPYVLAATAATAVDRAPNPALLRSLAAGSFDSLTRVAGGHPTLGAQMAEANRAPVAAVLRDWAHALVAVADRLDGGLDLAEAFSAGRAARVALDAAGHGAVATTRSLDRAGLLALGRDGGRVVAVRDATSDQVEVDAQVPVDRGAQ